MEVDFKNKKLEDLYTKGPTKKYPVPRRVAEEYVAALRELDAAVTIHDLWNKHPKRQFEKLQGRENGYSMRLTLQYRLELTAEWLNEEKTIGKFTVDDVSNHYE